METTLEIVPFAKGPEEAARLIDSEAAPIASVIEPREAVEPEAFRVAVLTAALERNERAMSTPVAGVLFAARWGGGGVMIT